jgi:DNA-binding HxlR family transcriptional regulator
VTGATSFPSSGAIRSRSHDIRGDADGPGPCATSPEHHSASVCEGLAAGIAEVDVALTRAVALLGDRWTLLIIDQIARRRGRFGQIVEALGVSTNVLSRRLATLLDCGVVELTPYFDRRTRYEYQLTSAGLTLEPVLTLLSAWGATQVGMAAPRRSAAMLPAQSGPRSAHIAAGDLTSAPGPDADLSGLR